METRANYVWVGAITLGLLACLVGFILWIARMNEGHQNQYDVFFKQSVSGLAKGSSVSFSGVPVGQVQVIELWPRDPSFVRVRISIQDTVPILQGTTATIQGSFTGVSDIQLEGAVKGAPPITEIGPEGVAVIPTKRGGLGELLNNAPLLLERLATLTERLNQTLSDDNQKSLKNILANTDRMSGELANATPQVRQTMAELQVTLRQASQTLASFEKVATSADSLLGEEGVSLAQELRATLNTASSAAKSLEATLDDSRPAFRRLNDNTLPAAEAAMRELQSTSRALRAVTEKLDERGAGAVLAGEQLPNYKP